MKKDKQEKNGKKDKKFKKSSFCNDRKMEVGAHEWIMK